MNIETYACETIPSDEYTGEAVELARQLGAVGQETFYQEGRPVQPYRLMTPEELAVYKLVLPIRDDIAKYTAGPIPLRVLQVGAHANELLTGTLVIWHQGVGKDDPLLTMREGSEWAGKYYLLARWGDVLEEFTVLRERAIQRYILAMKSKLLVCKQEVDAAIAQVETKAQQAIQNGKTDEPSFYWHT